MSLTGKIVGIVSDVGLRPYLRIDVETEPPSGTIEKMSVRSVVASGFSAILTISGRKEVSAKEIGPVFSFPSCVDMFPGNRTTLTFYYYMGFDSLEAMENAREGKELWFGFVQGRIVGIAIVHGTVSDERIENTCPLDITVHPPLYRLVRDDWIEFLGKTKLKRIRILEVSELAGGGEFAEASQYLESAWKFFHQGDYDQVLSECRRSIQSLGDAIRSLGYKKTIVVEEEKKEAPDWERYFNSETTGETISTINQKLYYFSSPASHPAKEVFGRADAEFLLFTVYSVLNYVSRSYHAEPK